MSSRRVGAELFHSFGRTDMTKKIVAFRKSANAARDILVGGQIVKKAASSSVKFSLFVVTVS